SRLWLLMGRPTEALTLGESALAAHDKVLGQDHPRTKDSARVTADALDALGPAEEAKALRERYGVARSADDPTAPWPPYPAWPRNVLAKVKQQLRALSRA